MQLNNEVDQAERSRWQQVLLSHSYFLLAQC